MEMNIDYDTYVGPLWRVYGINKDDNRIVFEKKYTSREEALDECNKLNNESSYYDMGINYNCEEIC